MWDPCWIFPSQTRYAFRSYRVFREETRLSLLSGQKAIATVNAHSPNQDRTGYMRTIRQVTWLGTATNLFLSIVKCIAGWISGSQALVADAVHSLSDMVTDAAVLLGLRYWSAPPDSSHPHGHGRLETLVSFFIGAALALVGIGLGLECRIQPSPSPGGYPGMGAFLAACISILLKEALYQWTIRVGRKVRSSAVIANAWHHRSDAPEFHSGSRCRGWVPTSIPIGTSSTKSELSSWPS